MFTVLAVKRFSVPHLLKLAMTGCLVHVLVQGGTARTARLSTAPMIWYVPLGGRSV
jgi:hypothetical protein